MITRISEIQVLDQCDEITADDIEACRKELGCTPAEFAEYLGWSTRKYQRAVDAAEEDGAAPRDMVLSFFGLTKLVGEARSRSSRGIRQADAESPAQPANGTSLFHGVDHRDVVEKICAERREKGQDWSADVTPHVLREAALCALRGVRVTYDDLAEKLETKGCTHRVWPRTAYGRPLGSVCATITELGRRTGVRIPLLSVIVVRKDGSPGEGFDEMTKDFFKVHEPARYRDLMSRMRNEREVMIAELQREVFQFSHWQEVLHTLGLDESERVVRPVSDATPPGWTDDPSEADRDGTRT